LILRSISVTCYSRTFIPFQSLSNGHQREEGKYSFYFVLFLRTIFQEGSSEPANFSEFTPVPPVVTFVEGQGPHCGGVVTGTALWRCLYKDRTVEVSLQVPHCGGVVTGTVLWRYLYKNRTVEVSLQGPHCGGIFTRTALWRYR